MLLNLRGRFGLANIVSLVALVVALGGTSGAVAKPYKDVFASSSERTRLTAGERAALRRVSKPGTEVQIERRLGVPTILWAAEPHADGGTPERAARRHLKRLARHYRLSAADVDSAEVVSVHDTGRGAVIVKLRQSVAGVPVFREEANVLMTQDLGILGVGGYLSPTEGAEPEFSLGAREAVARAAGDLLSRTFETNAFRPQGRRGPYELFAADALSEPARAKRVLYRLPERLAPAYYVEVHAARGDEHFGYVVGAGDGRVLSRHDLVSDADFSYRVWADSAAPHMPMDGPQGTAGSPHPTGVPDGFEPPFVAPSLVQLTSGPISTGDPWLPENATETTGNNVEAYADHNSPDGFTTGDTRATTTGSHAFDRVYDTGLEPLANTSQVQASITQLFYTTNFLHDWFYEAGFDEAARNAQADNYGRGGLGGDSMRAEAQDNVLGGSRNNANMSTPADGGRPRMQVFVFTGRDQSSLTVNSPAGIAGQYRTGRASFGPATFEVTDDLVLANDGQGASSTDGCEAMTGLSGLIAVIDRGNCTFPRKARNAQDAGAVGVIIVNSVQTTNPPTLAPDSTVTPPPTVPILSLTLADGNTIKGALTEGSVNATMRRTKDPDRDGAIDNQLVAHEWGHYLTRRLIGNGTGASTTQSAGLGEGWSDFVALLMTARPEDVATASGLAGVFPYGGYSFHGLQANASYFGFRRVPYSTDFTKNALTFKHISDGEPLPNVPTAPNGEPNSEVHNTGEIWATMLWEAYAALLGETQGSNPRLTFAQAQTRMREYLVASLKLTPSAPTLVEARDALLMVAAAADQQDMVAFWEAFARRGAGTGAIAPDRSSTNNSGVVESFATAGSFEFVSATLEDDQRSCDGGDGYVDNRERGRLRITVRNDGARRLDSTTATITSGNPHVRLEDSSISFPATEPFQTAEASAVVSLEDATEVQELDFDISIEDADVAGAPVTAEHVTLAAARVSLNASADDDVESPTSAWSPQRQTGQAGQADWTRRTTFGPHNGLWHGPDAGHTSDTSLVSPPLAAGSGAVSFSFRHRFSFETTPTERFDAGVIELSTDGGATWADVSTVAASTGYNGTVHATNSSNPLANRQAYTAASPAYPDFTTQTIDLGTALAGTTFLVRFRVGTDQGAGDDGWEIDDLSFTGVTNTPFHRLVADAGCPEPVITGPETNTDTGSGTGLEVGPGIQLPDLAVTISRVALGARRIRSAAGGPAIVAAAPVGTRVSYDLSEAAPVTLRYERKTTGRRVGGRCRAATRRNRRRPSCTRWVRLPGSESLDGNAGANAFRLTGRWRGRALPPQQYRLLLEARDAGGNTSLARSPAFHIVRR